MVIDTDYIVKAALYTGGVVLLLVVLLMMQVIVLRMRMLSDRKRRYQLLKKWRPELTRILLGGQNNMPKLPAKEMCVFLEEWNKMFGSVRGDHLNVLVKLAHKLQIGYFARRQLTSRSMRTRLFAIVTLGHMREYAAWDELIDLLQHPHAILSLTAARALMWIDAKNAVDIIIPVILQRRDWPWSNVAHVLQQASPFQVCEKLAQAIERAPSDRQPGLLRYLDTTKCMHLTKAVANILRSTEDDRIASICLHIITDPNALDVVRKFTQHPRWHVRMHAATALGRLGSETDIPLLLQLTSDDQWWVRYRAALAMSSMPFMDIEKLKHYEGLVSDQYARDILMHVIAEVQLT